MDGSRAWWNDQSTCVDRTIFPAKAGYHSDTHSFWIPNLYHAALEFGQVGSEAGGSGLDMTTPNKWKSWIQKLGYLEKPRAERRAPSGFSARRRNSSVSIPAAVRDISSTGLHILTEERWPLGELITLTVQVEPLVVDHSEPQIEVQAQVVRHGEGGIGLRFVLPEGVDPNLWDVLLRNVVVLDQPKDILHNLRVLRTVLFLCRLCHAGAHPSIELFGGALDLARTENAMEIAFRAEKLLAAGPDAEKMRAHPDLVLRILKHGSWADSLTRQLWAGLLATSCTVDGKDESNSEFAELLVNVTRSQCRILLAGCMKALEAGPATSGAPSPRIIVTNEQMIRLTDMYDQTRNATDIAYLFTGGMIEKNFDFTSYVTTEIIDITPTPLGLELYKRGKGDCINPDSTLDVWNGAGMSPQMQLQLTDVGLQLTADGLQVGDGELQIADFRLPNVDDRLQITDYELTRGKGGNRPRRIRKSKHSA